jgi:hypothetical protein
MRWFGSLLAVVSALLVVPAAAHAAGPATFVRAEGGTDTATLYPSGLTIYSASPAYIALLRSRASASIEATRLITTSRPSRCATVAAGGTGRTASSTRT